MTKEELIMNMDRCINGIAQVDCEDCPYNGEDFCRLILMQKALDYIKEKAECNKIDLKKVLVPYDDSDECDEGVVTPIICNGRADVIPTEVNTEEVGVTSTFIYDGEVKEVYLK